MLTIPMLDDRVVRGGLREQVSERILRSVFEARFASGQHLVVQNLAEMYGVSQTPVRESLVELAGLGIVELLPNRGAVVKPFGPKELEDLAEVRRVLESEAARKACGKLRAEAVAGLKAELLRLQGLPMGEAWDEGARRADTRLHSMIRMGCGNSRLSAEIERYLAMFRILRDVARVKDAPTKWQRSNDVPEHLRIVDALIAGQPEDARAAMDAHLQTVGRALQEILFAGEGRGK